MNAYDVKLPAKLEARLPKTIVVNGTTEVDGVNHADALRFFCSLTLAELRQRQALCREQQGMAYDLAKRDNFRPPAYVTKAAAKLDITDHLLTEAVGYTSFEDWGAA